MAVAGGQDEWKMHINVNPTQVRDLLKQPAVQYLSAKTVTVADCHSNSRDVTLTADLCTRIVGGIVQR